MKKTLLILAALLPIAACNPEALEIEADETPVVSGSQTFYGYTDTQPYTKTVMNDSLRTVWSKGDEVAIFEETHMDSRYQVASYGERSTAMTSMNSYKRQAREYLYNNIAYYPYDSSISYKTPHGIPDEIVLTSLVYTITGITLPSKQTYLKDNIGQGAAPMVAVTSSVSDCNLMFKNLCGILCVKLMGAASVTSISVSGNNNEILCGPATVSASNSGDPTITLTGTDDSCRKVTLDCGDGVTISSKFTSPTVFYIVLPPVEFTKGIHVRVSGKNNNADDFDINVCGVIARNRILETGTQIVSFTSPL